jgi:hypothetical protein
MLVFSLAPTNLSSNHIHMDRKARTFDTELVKTISRDKDDR